MIVFACKVVVSEGIFLVKYKTRFRVRKWFVFAEPAKIEKFLLTELGNTLE